MQIHEIYMNQIITIKIQKEIENLNFVFKY